MLSFELETRALVGREANDIYGRQLGRIIGIERNSHGELDGIQVEAAGGNILTFKASQIAITPNTVTLTPEWKIESEIAIIELTTLRKRVTALESLKGSEEVDFEIYAEILGIQKAGYLDKVKRAQSLVDVMNVRLSEIIGQMSSLSKCLINAKLDHKSGQLDESAFKMARDSIEPSLKPLMTERNELATKLKTLEQFLPQRVSLD